MAEEEQEPLELTDKDVELIDKIDENGPEDINLDVPEERNRSESVEESTPVDESRDADAADDGSEGAGQTTDDLAVRARNLGLNPDDFSNQEALHRNVAVAEQNYAQYYQQQQQQQQAQSQYQNQAPPEQQEWKLPEFKVELDEDYDEGLKDAINGLASQMSGHYNQQMEVLAQHILNQQDYIGRFADQEQRANSQAELDEFSSAVKELGNDGLFGEGVYQESKSGGDEAQNMERLYDQAYTIASGYSSQGRQVPEMNELVRQAYQTVFTSEIDNQGRQERNDRLRRSSSQRLGGGGSTKATPQTTEGEDDIVNSAVLKDAFDGFLKDNGDL
tara:strand:+ start:4914 stop:5909 length:996 start_codon:yes stop_codon:yes gene_type:complete